MNLPVKLAAIAGLLSVTCLPVSAGELRLGVAKHDIKDRESGADIQLEYVFGRMPDYAGRRWGVRPYLVAVTNTDGYIDFAGAGLQPEIAINENWFAELQLGVVGHNGRTDLPPPDMPVERQNILDTEVTYGCEALFHLAPAIGRKVSDKVSVSLYWEHLSHGQVFCSGKNEGLDNYGVRIGFDL